ncbi:sugar porter family MFS transporter [Actinomadura litoris]|uniref:sugar porter family MFS transporter n=1 Tax=Actinomadura litoris TaxID=2678616 RepID=UPI001FA7B6AE|nr:sugar porter family MFS transporter [Actinomadura litoris]
MQGYSGAPVAEGPVGGISAEGRRRIWFHAVLIAVGGFLFGFDTGVISGALLFIRTDFHLNSFEQGSVVSVLVLGAMAGALGSGRIADRIGRRWIFCLEGVVFLIGTAIAVLSTGYGMLVAGRLVLGLAVGAASATVPPYLAEISPKEIRGRLLTLNQLMITIGILVAYLVNLVFSGGGTWRAMIGVGAVPALVMVVSALRVLPESPEWLLAHGRRAQARELVASVSDGETADRLIRRREERLRRAREQADPADRDATGWRALRTRRVRPALVVGLALAAGQQFGGINTIIYYAPTIIEESGLTASNAIVYSIAIGAINLVMTLVAIRMIDRVGRRDLLLASFAAMAVTMGLLGLAFVAGWRSGVSLLFMVLYIAAYAGGVGPVFWTLIGELFPSSASATGSSACTAANWASNFTVSLVFLPVVSLIGEGETFWIFAVISLAGLLFTARFVPETKARDFTEVDRDLQARFGAGRPGRRIAG